MSRCANTHAMLEAAFAERDLTRDEAAHVAACAECAHALALQRRFDSDLGAIAQDLAPVHAGPIDQLIDLAPPNEKSIVSWRSGFIGAAAVAVVLVVVAMPSLIGGAGTGSSLARLLGLPVEVPEAARAFGISEAAVLTVGDDAIGLDIDETPGTADVKVLVMSAQDRKVREVYEQELTVLPGSNGLFSRTVECFGVTDRDLYAVVAMYWPMGRVPWVSVEGVEGHLAEFETRGGRGGGLFVAYADEVDPHALVRVQLGTGGPPPAPLVEDEFVAQCASPSTATCGQWADWQPSTRQSITRWLVEDRLESARTSQQLPPGASEDEIVTAATSSVDKNCQFSAPDLPLTRIVERLYD